MKKTILLFILIVYSNLFFGQSIKLYNNYDLLIGKKIVLIENEKESYDVFFTDENGLVTESSTKIYKKLVNKEFLIEKISETKYGFKLFVLNYNNKKAFMRTSNPGYYYKVIDKIEIPKDLICTTIKYREDKFDGSKTYSTPDLGSLSITKMDGRIYMTIKKNSNEIQNNEKGVTFLLNNGTKINFPEQKIKTKVGSGVYFENYAFIDLNDENIKLLSEYDITDFRIGTQDKHINIPELKEYLKCMTK